jgi:CubicO group peptidase (beta-lactamase class C family)
VDVSRWAGQTVRLRLVVTDNGGPLRVGVDNIFFAPIDADSDDRIELLDTPKPSSALNLVLHRLSEGEAVAALAARAEKLAHEDEFSGAVLVARDDEVLLADAWGRADREAGIPNTPETKFRIGSMNKMFTAVATLQLVEAGKLALDDPIGKHLRDYPNKQVASKVTVRHLLTQTGGTGDIFGPEFEQNRLKLRNHGDYLKLYGSRRPGFEPGAPFEYSNYGFVLLGALIEAVSGVSYYDYVREHVFRPAGMTATDSLPESEDVPDRAVGYTKRFPGDAWQPTTDMLPWRGTAAGGGYSTVGDLLRFAQALSSGTLISKEMLEEATRAHQQDYGYGFGCREKDRCGATATAAEHRARTASSAYSPSSATSSSASAISTRRPPPASWSTSRSECRTSNRTADDASATAEARALPRSSRTDGRAPFAPSRWILMTPSPLGSAPPCAQDVVELAGTVAGSPEANDCQIGGHRRGAATDSDRQRDRNHAISRIAPLIGESVMHR